MKEGAVLGFRFYFSLRGRFPVIAPTPGTHPFYHLSTICPGEGRVLAHTALPVLPTPVADRLIGQHTLLLGSGRGCEFPATGQPQPVGPSCCLLTPLTNRIAGHTGPGGARGAWGPPLAFLSPLLSGPFLSSLAVRGIRDDQLDPVIALRKGQTNPAPTCRAWS